MVAAQLHLHSRHTRILQEIAYDNKNVLVLQRCATATVTSVPNAAADHTDIDAWQQQLKSESAGGDVRCRFPDTKPYSYPAVYADATFCLIARNARLVQTNLLEALAANCVPVIMADNVVMPFGEIIDWSLAAITIREANLHSVAAVLQAVSPDRIDELQQQGRVLYTRYFADIKQIVRTTLDELNDRVFPHLAKNYLQWNIPVTPKSAQNPLFLSLTAPRSQGFTAVVLTYDRIESLFTLIQKLSVVPSLQKILVIWNNQKKAPPHRKWDVAMGEREDFVCLLFFFVFCFVQRPCFRKSANP